MQALDIAVRMIVGPGEEALVPSPAWPNFAGALAANGARAVFVPLDRGEAWRLDPERLAAAVTPATRAIFFNSPANPTGFVATRAELIAVLDIARRRDLWIVADEIYGRLTYDGRRAPSFHDIMAPDDKILFVQTLSKNWAMTGWRIGWLEAPPAFAPVIENLVQYSSSGVPVFIQRAAVAALDQGEAFLADLAQRMRASRDILSDGLKATGRVRFSRARRARSISSARSTANPTRAGSRSGSSTRPASARRRGTRSAPAARDTCASALRGRPRRSARRRAGSSAGSEARRLQPHVVAAHAP